MINGTVNTNREPIIQITIQDADGQEQERDAVVDTGFNGWLTLPHEVIASLGLHWQRLGTALLADGTTVLFDVFEATVLWDGHPLTIPVDEADSDPLVGMSLMYGYELTVQSVDGGIVMLRKM